MLESGFGAVLWCCAVVLWCLPRRTRTCAQPARSKLRRLVQEHYLREGHRLWVRPLPALPRGPQTGGRPSSLSAIARHYGVSSPPSC